MDELMNTLRDKWPSVIDVEECGSNILVVLPKVTDAAEDVIFTTIGNRAIIATLDAYEEIRGETYGERRISPNDTEGLTGGYGSLH